jgi:hypothetical protein
MTTPQGKGGPPGTQNATPKPPGAAKEDRAEGDKYVVYNEARTRSFGSYATRSEAEKRLAELEAHKDSADPAPAHKSDDH